MSAKFQRCKEDFICEVCNLQVQGSGFTNHCPRCLWSKHVDVNPGDRDSSCQGLMEPIGVELDHGKYRILHRCTRCGIEKRNKAAQNDDFESILSLARKQVGGL
jgi:hypothetical protein